MMRRPEHVRKLLTILGMNKYLLAKTAAIFFSVTTVILFIFAREGALYVMVGSVQLGIALYFINTLLLVVSLIAYFWQKVQRDVPAHPEVEILAKYAELEANQAKDESARIPTDKNA